MDLFQPSRFFQVTYKMFGASNVTWGIGQKNIRVSFKTDIFSERVAAENSEDPLKMIA